MVMYRKRKCKYRRETWQPCGDLLSRKWYSSKRFWFTSESRWRRLYFCFQLTNFLNLFLDSGPSNKWFV